MKIGITNDHRGLSLKKQLLEKLKEEEYDVVDLGTNTDDRVDYPKYAFELAEKVAKKELDYGIAICGSAIGINVACNKVKGARCGIIDTLDDVIHGKSKDYINIIALRGESIDVNKALDLVLALVNTNYDDDPTYYDRVKQIKAYEEGTYYEC